jgi:hypothetical protein
MKTVLIIIVVLWVLLTLFKNTKIYHEAVLLADLRKNIDNKSLLRGMIMNNIKSRAANELLNEKISEAFYKKMFYGGDAQTPWWEVNRENIKG